MGNHGTDSSFPRVQLIPEDAKYCCYRGSIFAIKSAHAEAGGARFSRNEDRMQAKTSGLHTKRLLAGTAVILENDQDVICLK